MARKRLLVSFILKRKTKLDKVRSQRVVNKILIRTHPPAGANFESTGATASRR